MLLNITNYILVSLDIELHLNKSLYNSAPVSFSTHIFHHFKHIPKVALTAENKRFSTQKTYEFLERPSSEITSE